MTLIADGFLAGSLLTLLLPVALLIALVAWYMLFLKRVPEPVDEEGVLTPAAPNNPGAVAPTAAAPDLPAAAPPATAPNPAPGDAPGGTTPPEAGQRPGQP